MYLTKSLQERIILRYVNIEHIPVKKFKENDRFMWFLVTLMCFHHKDCRNSRIWDDSS